jgi:DNA-binding GntR family transcriptional regulator
MGTSFDKTTDQKPAQLSVTNRGTLVDEVYARIESMIVMLQLSPGALLSEVELGRQFGVSRTPVGEALQRLAREGLVTILPRRGILVTEVNIADQLRLQELRREVSRFIARCGAARATTEERARIATIASNFLQAAEADDKVAVMRADKEFHDLFATCAHNSYAAASMSSMDSLSRRFWYVHRDARGSDKESARLHADIALAIAEGNQEKAVQASDAFADYLDAFTRSILR